jgi:hypothetical protein
MPFDDFAPKFDCFLDAIFGVMLEGDEARGAAVIPLVLALLGRPLAPNESLPRDVLLSIKKFLAEAKPSERKVILGWLINTRLMLLSLPDDKFTIWSRDLKSTIKHKRATRESLNCLLGRLNHAVVAVPLGRHFLGRLYKAQQQANKRGFVHFTEAQLADLILWIHFLEMAHTGISLNQLVFRDPQRVIRIDACPWGIGGYTLTSDVAWRWRLPPEFLRRVSLNGLEFLAIFVGIWMEIHFGPPLSEHEVFLSQGDSTSASGWMRKSSFYDNNNPFLLHVARATAELLTKHKIQHYSQWFPGKHQQLLGQRPQGDN